MTIAKSLTAIRNTTSRRKFLAGAALAGAGVIAMPQVSRAQTVTLKMQSSWGPKDIFQDMARQYTDRVDAMSGGRLKIDLLAAGAVVKAFQVQDAVHKGVLDAPAPVPSSPPPLPPGSSAAKRS